MQLDKNISTKLLTTDIGFEELKQLVKGTRLDYKDGLGRPVSDKIQLLLS